MELLRPYVGYGYIFMTIALTVYGQIVVKWQVSKVGAMPPGVEGKLGFMLGMLLNPWVLSGFFAAFLASFCWMAALTKFPLNVAYPFTSLSFVAVLLASAVLFYEPVTLAKWVGLAFLILGVVISSQKW
ncbi:putative 4-amino-4-deoxy-L-arabinose-phosphoundecaprenol flippase subunit ArnE [compost metagenome]